MAWKVYQDPFTGKMELVKDGYSWLTLLLGVLYLFYKGLWGLGMIVLIGGGILVTVLNQLYPGLGSLAGFLITAGVGAITWKKYEEKLISKGWRYLATYETKEEAKAYMYNRLAPKAE